MTRDELIELRKHIMRGNPPYVLDDMGNKRRQTGHPGLEELKGLGDFSPNASGVVLALETHLQLIDHLLERTK